MLNLLFFSFLLCETAILIKGPPLLGKEKREGAEDEEPELGFYF